MRPSFLPRLVNGPFDDPGLFIPLAHSKRAILFDLGDVRTLSPGDMLKISHVFVTHTHMDHFIGFDNLLRLMLGRDKELVLFGPEGFLDNVAAKLMSYTWNLVQNYEEGLVITAVEVQDGKRMVQRFACRNRFVPESVETVKNDSPALLVEPALEVQAARLDHQIPSLAFSIKEQFHVNILKTAVHELGLQTGPWLSQFKALLFQEADPATEISAPLEMPGNARQTYSLEQLSRKIARITSGQKVAYVADAVYSKANASKIVSLAKDADHLYIEAAFLETERDIARKKFHLTARQAGTIARKANVAEMTIFHHSPRYRGRAGQLVNEARAAFKER